jgi:hypothetical protein
VPRSIAMSADSMPSNLPSMKSHLLIGIGWRKRACRQGEFKTYPMTLR